MLRILCCGMGAYMEPQQALWRAMLDYCTVVESLGWTVENWRDVLMLLTARILILRDEEKALFGEQAVKTK